jgi:hypothetical protein
MKLLIFFQNRPGFQKRRATNARKFQVAARGQGNDCAIPLPITLAGDPIRRILRQIGPLLVVNLERLANFPLI